METSHISFHSPESGQAPLDEEDPDPPRSSTITYMASSKAGYGHLSRAVAIAQELGPETPFTVAAHPNGHSFTQGNIGDSLPLYQLQNMDYKPDSTEHSFFDGSPGLRDTILGSRIVINDFMTQIPLIREALIAEDAPPLVGVYHSIYGYNTDEIAIRQFQDKYRKIAGDLDYLILTEPKQDHQQPYELDSGTIVVPVDPIVRTPSRSPEEIKYELGLHPEDEFVYIQGGMRGSSELRSFVTCLSQISLNGLKLVLAPIGELDYRSSRGDIIVLPRRADGHNIVAAASGIISKPGMGTVCEAVAYRKPLLLVDHTEPEPRLKISMLGEILGDLPHKLELQQSIGAQVSAWFEAKQEITQKFSEISCDGARKAAGFLLDLCNFDEASQTA